jgi:hypothetical protein
VFIRICVLRSLNMPLSVRRESFSSSVGDSRDDGGGSMS